jgi:signal peptidase II
MVLEQSWEIVSGFFYITYIRNFGVAFGMFSNLAPALRQVLVLVLPCLILVLLLVLYFWKDFQERIPTLGLCLVISGAVSNLLDRFFLGYVVDFLDFDLGLMRWPAFNVADSCVTVGGIGLMIFFTFFHRPPAPQSSFRASPKASSRSS